MTSSEPTKNTLLGGLSASQIISYGTAIAIGAITLFGLLWWGLGALGLDQLPRLAFAVCLPPLVMTVALFALYLRRASTP
ncbi:MAG: hypothetical protein ACOYL5_20035 [Phototrophicaceae bacterium]|jgi:hypothetical protein